MGNPRYVLGLDPGPTESALVVWDCQEQRAHASRFLGNEDMLRFLSGWSDSLWRTVGVAVPAGSERLIEAPLVIEEVVSYGMPVGKEVFDTVYWSGIFAHAYGLNLVHLLPRLDVKLHLCGNSRARDSNIRRALLDRFPAGTKANPGPMHGITGHMIAAAAVAITWSERLK
jgi:hypothetical protein